MVDDHAASEDPGDTATVDAQPVLCLDQLQSRLLFGQLPAELPGRAPGALDTFEDEPLALDSRLRGLDRERVILTPHRIGVSRQGWAGNQRLLVQSVFDAMAGKVPGPVTNRDAIPTWLERFGAK